MTDEVAHYPFQIVGPVLFENEDGLPLATATYAIHARLRAPQLKFRGLYYYQNRQEQDRWVYRQVSGTPAIGAAQDSDPALEEIRVPPLFIIKSPEPAIMDEVTVLKARVAELEGQLAAQSVTVPTEPVDG